RGMIRIAREATPAGTIAAVDAGPHLMDVVAGWHAVAPREFLVSNARASAGFALPAAIAAHFVRPDRRIVCFTGTEGLTAAGNELEAATRLGTPVVVVAFGAGASDAPDLARLAETFGVKAFVADGEVGFGEAVSRALRTAGPTLIAVS